MRCSVRRLSRTLGVINTTIETFAMSNYHWTHLTRFFALLGATTLLAGIAAGQATSSEEPTIAPASHSTGEVIAAAAAIVAAFGRHDPKAYFALFAPDATFVFYTTPQRLNSRAEYEAEWANWEKNDAFRVRSCRSKDPRVQVFGDVAVFSHSVRTELSTKQGDNTVLERETIVFHRRGGRWVGVHEHLSPDPEQESTTKE